MDWDTAKEFARLAFRKTAEFALYQGTVLYIIACVAAGQPIGPAKYAEFLYRIFTFK